MTLDPDPLDVTQRLVDHGVAVGAWAWRNGYRAGRSSFRWYLLASFVTGLLLGAAVARTW